MMSYILHNVLIMMRGYRVALKMVENSNTGRSIACAIYLTASQKVPKQLNVEEADLTDFQRALHIAAGVSMIALLKRQHQFPL
jgi:hypothetical protein